MNDECLSDILLYQIEFQAMIWSFDGIHWNILLSKLEIIKRLNRINRNIDLQSICLFDVESKFFNWLNSVSNNVFRSVPSDIA